MHFVAFPGGFLMMKALSYLNTQGNLKCTTKDVGASEKSKIQSEIVNKDKQSYDHAGSDIVMQQVVILSR